MDWKIAIYAGMGIIGLAILTESGLPPAAIYAMIAGGTAVGTAAFIAKSPIGEAIADRIRNYDPEKSDIYVGTYSGLKKKKNKSQFETDLEQDIEGFVEDLIDGIFPNRRSKQMKEQERTSEVAEDQSATPISDFPEGLIAVMFTDMEDFTKFIERGDAPAFAILKKHNDIIKNAAEHWGGRVVKGYGDGFMIAYTSARKAVSAAVSMQELMQKHNASVISSEKIRVRVGIDAGEPIKEGDDYIGRTVNMAARIAAAARGGQIYVSQTVKHLVGPIQDIQFIDHGPHSLKGFNDPETLFEVSQIEAIAHPLESDISKNLAAIEDRLSREN